MSHSMVQRGIMDLFSWVPIEARGEYATVHYLVRKNGHYVGYIYQETRGTHQISGVSK